jgi:hypothetical protein
MPAHPTSAITQPANVPAFRFMLSIAISFWFGQPADYDYRNAGLNAVPSLVYGI